MKGVCRNCMRRRVVIRAQRKGGGSYNRASRWYTSYICEECVASLLEYWTPGHSSVSRWGVGSLRYAAKRFEKAT